MFPDISQSRKRKIIEANILLFSQRLFKNPILGIIISVLLNILYFYNWYIKRTLFSTFLFLFLVFLLFGTIVSKFKENNDNEELYYKEYKNDTEKYFIDVGEESFITKTVNCKNIVYTFKILLFCFVLMKLFNVMNEKIICWLFMNICIFYSPIDKKCPYFLFKSRIFIRQCLEAILGVISCFIPKYEEIGKK